MLRDLNLTSSSGSAIRINDNAEVQIVVDGKVVLKEKSPAGKKGAAIKAGRGTAVYVTGTGSMKISSVYDGIAMGLAILIIPIVEIIKAFQRASARRKGEELRS